MRIWWIVSRNTATDILSITPTTMIQCKIFSGAFDIWGPNLRRRLDYYLDSSISMYSIASSRFYLLPSDHSFCSYYLAIHRGLTSILLSPLWFSVPSLRYSGYRTSCDQSAPGPAGVHETDGQFLVKLLRLINPSLTNIKSVTECPRAHKFRAVQ